MDGIADCLSRDLPIILFNVSRGFLSMLRQFLLRYRLTHLLRSGTHNQHLRNCEFLVSERRESTEDSARRNVGRRGANADLGAALKVFNVEEKVHHQLSLEVGNNFFLDSDHGLDCESDRGSDHGSDRGSDRGSDFDPRDSKGKGKPKERSKGKKKESQEVMKRGVRKGRGTPKKEMKKKKKKGRKDSSSRAVQVTGDGNEEASKSALVAVFPFIDRLTNPDFIKQLEDFTGELL